MQGGVTIYIYVVYTYTHIERPPSPPPPSPALQRNESAPLVTNEKEGLCSPLPLPLHPLL